jgi:hypothetical protein
MFLAGSGTVPGVGVPKVVISGKLGQPNSGIPSGARTMSDWISDEALLTEGYRRSAKLTWLYCTTYFWGAALLPKPQRKHVHAIYALPASR